MNTFALELTSERLAEPGKPGLGRGVGRIERRADQRDTGGDIHDHRVATLTQRRQGGACQQDRRDKIDVDHSLQLGFGYVLEAPGSDASGVVDEDVEPAQRVDGLPDRRRASARVRDVGGDAPDGWTGSPKLPDRARKSIGPPASDDDFRALTQESVRKREADAARSAGDQDTLAFDLQDCVPAILSCVLVSKSLASWRSRSCSDGSPLVRLTMRPRLTAGRARMASAQRCTFR